MRNLTTLPTLTIHRLWLAVLLVLLVAGIAFVPGAAAQGGDNSPQLTVLAAALNVRGGPDVTYPVVDLLAGDDVVAVIGRHAASGWWQVRLADENTGWVSGWPAYVQVSGDTAGLPEVAVAVPSAGAIPSAAPAASAPVANPGPAGTIVFQTVSGGPIYAINADGTNLRYLTTGLDPALSLDGHWVAFTRWQANQHGALGNLWLININGSGERAILGDVRQPRTPVWSFDGAQIVIGMQHGGPRLGPERKCGSRRPPAGAYDISFKRRGPGEFEVCYTLPPDPFWGLRMVDTATGKFEDLPNENYSFSPAWDPANPWRLVYDGNMGLVNLDLNLGTSWPLTNDIHDHSPVFSPDGSKITVSYLQHDHWDIHLLNADGSGRVRLTETPLRVIVEQEIKGETPRSWNNAAPVWSPDGTRIAYLSDRTGQWEIWVMNADGSNQRPLFPAERLAGVTLQYNGVDERVLSWR